jgi:predicted DNA-binding antitoxin AbrB/MazE fold protein
MTTQIVRAVYEEGIFRPVACSNIKIPKGQQVLLVVETEEKPKDILSLAMHVYDGLSEEEVDEIEKIVLDRESFFGEKANA